MADSAIDRFAPQPSPDKGGIQQQWVRSEAETLVKVFPQTNLARGT